MPLKYKTTSDIKVSKKIVNQVIGQEPAVDVIKKAAKQRRHVFLIGEPGTGKCVGKDTKIITESGPFKAKELYQELSQDAAIIKKGEEEYILPAKKISAYSLDRDGKVVVNRILKAYKGKRKKGIRIRTRTGADFIVSGEHPVLTIKDGRMQFLPSDEISESSYIALARKLQPKTTDNLIQIKKLFSPNVLIEDGLVQFIGRNGVRSSRLRVPKVIDSSIAYFLGLCVAEARWQGNLVIYNSNQAVQQKIIDILREKFDYPAEYIVRSKQSVFLRKSRTLAHIMEKCFDFTLQTTKQSYHKKIPSSIFQTDTETISGFISGLIDGDGHIGKRGFELTSSSKELIDGLRILLLNLSIQSRTSSGLKYASNTKDKIRRVYHKLSIYNSENLRKLGHHLKLLIDYKTEGFVCFQNKPSNTNTDIIPTIGKNLYELKEKSGFTYDELGQYHATFHKFRYGRRNVSRDLANTIIDRIKEIQGRDSLILETKEIGELDTLVKSDIFWDKILSMDLVEDDMYDFEIEETHNLVISSGVIVHNSMLGLALAELLPKEKLVDILSFHNPNDENSPLIRTVPAGQGRQLIAQSKIQGSSGFRNQTIIYFILLLVAMFAPFWALDHYSKEFGNTAGAIMFAAFWLGGMLILFGFMLFLNVGRRMAQPQARAPKVIVENYKKKQAPFFDATGAHAGALLGDVLHDPFQSGGLGTPAHERVVAGMIHKANLGVVFIDEIATLDRITQQELLSALQERKFSITGQSERSAGAMVRTEPVPCDFVLVAAGNLETIKNMHPALRSRIRGYGYEIFMEDTIKDTPENRDKIAIFVAQEVAKDKRIPHFDKKAVEEIIQEARRRANRKGHLTLRLRDLGGLVRAAGDLAVESNAKLVTKKHVTDAKLLARPLEKQMADKHIERKKQYQVIMTEGKKIGRVNGMAVIGGESSFSGIILPIEAQVTAGGKKADVVATGKLGDIAKEAVKNVSAIIMNYFGEDIKETYDIYIQFLQTYEGVEGDSASIAIAVAIISAFKKIPVRQDTSMTGSLSVRGEVLPVGGVSSKVEAAMEAGMKQVIVPKANLQDIVIDDSRLKGVKIIPVASIDDVLKVALDWNGNKGILNKILKK